MTTSGYSPRTAAFVLRYSSFVFLLLSGCTPWSTGESWNPFDDKPKPQACERMVAVWNTTVLHQPGKPPIRGFGGRILFYGKDEKQSVPVAGSMSVYAFDDETANLDNPRPVKKFAFTPEELPKHRSDSSLGPAYSFWLPWDAVGGQTRKLSLIAKLEDASGRLVASPVVHVTLPADPDADDRFGPATGRAAAPAGTAGWGPVQQVSYDGPAAPRTPLDGPPPRRMATATIDVAPDQAQRLLGTRGDTVAAAARGATATPPVAEPPAAAATAPSTVPASSPAQASPPAATKYPATAPARAAFERKRSPLGESLRRLPPTPRSGWNRSANADADSKTSGEEGR